MLSIMDGSFKKFPNAQSNIGIYNRICTTEPKWFNQMIMLIECLDAFNLEDRNHVQEITMELISFSPNIFEPKLLISQISGPVLQRLLISNIEKVTDPTMRTFVGIQLRMFLTEIEWIKGWMNLEIIAKLSDNVLTTDFSVQTECLETLQCLFLPERDNVKRLWGKFCEHNAIQILDSFNEV